MVVFLWLIFISFARFQIKHPSLNPQRKNPRKIWEIAKAVANDEKQSAKKREAAKIADDIGQPKEIS